MLNLILGVTALVWVQEHMTTVLIVLGVLVALLAWMFWRRKKRRDAYLALPVLYIGNSSTKVYHSRSCPLAAKIQPQHRVAFRMQGEPDRAGYSPCGSCKPH